MLWGAGATRAALAAAIIAAGDAKGNRAPLGIKLGVAPQAYGSKRHRGDLRQSRCHHHTVGAGAGGSCTAPHPGQVHGAGIPR